jgi:hypothetical protein
MSFVCCSTPSTSQTVLCFRRIHTLLYISVVWWFCYTMAWSSPSFFHHHHQFYYSPRISVDIAVCVCVFESKKKQNQNRRIKKRDRERSRPTSHKSKSQPFIQRNRTPPADTTSHPSHDHALGSPSIRFKG